MHRTICFHLVDLENVVIFVAAKTDQIHSKKKTSTKVDIINYLLSSSRDTTTDVQIVNFEFIM